MYCDFYRKREHYEYVSMDEIYALIEDAKISAGCIIYGAGRYAKAVIKCVREIDPNMPIIGIAVTSTENNVSICEGINVKEIENFNNNKNVPIWIATQENWQEEIFCSLKKLGYEKVIPISQLHINQLGEMYFRRILRKVGFDTDILDLINIKRLFRDYWKNRFNNMCDLFGNIKMSMYKRASEETADFVVENMLNATCYDNRWPMHCEVCQRAGEGLYLEFGVAAGGSINGFAEIRKDKIFFGFDSFEGLPEDWSIAATGFEKGSIRQNKLPAVRENVQLVVGLFNQTLPTFLESHKEKVAFLHIDCDLYSSTKYVLDTLMMNRRLLPGTEIVFDEFMNFPGWKKESEYTAFIEMAQKYDIKYEYTGFAMDSCQVSMRIL